MFAVRCVQDLSLEKLLVCKARPLGQRIADVSLQAGDEVLIAFACHHRKHVDLVNQGRIIDAHTMLVDGQTKATTHFLPPGDGVVAVLECADDENVGVVPALSQRRMREDEADRFFELEQLLFVAQDQIVGIDVIGFTRLRARIGVDQTLALLVDREVAFVCPRGLDAFQIAPVRRFLDPKHLVEVSVVFFFKDRCVLAGYFTLVVVLPILGHFVDKEQRQHLDALVVQHLLFLEVRFDGLANLDAAHRCLVDITDSFARDQVDAITEAHRIDTRIDLGHHIALVLIQSARQVIQIVIAAELAHQAFDATVLADFQLHPCHRRLACRDFDAF